MISDHPELINSFLKQLTAARKAMVTYPRGHQMQKKSFEILLHSLQDILKYEKDLTLLSENHQLTIADMQITEEDPAVSQLINELSERRFRGLVFKAGLQLKELEIFLGLMSLPVADVISSGGYQKAFRHQGLLHIQALLLEELEKSDEKTLIINGQKLTVSMLERLKYPSIVEKILKKLIELHVEEGEGINNALPLEKTLENLDHLVMDQILKGISPEKVIDTMVTPEGISRFRMKEGSSGLEEDIIAEINAVNDSREEFLFLIELMRTLNDNENYGKIAEEFVERVNNFIMDENHRNLVKVSLFFMLEERRHKSRNKVFNRAMEAINLKEMVHFVLFHLDRKGNLEKTILGTMIRSFGEPVAAYVLEYYLDSEDAWVQEVAREALLHGSRHAIKVLLSLEEEKIESDIILLVRLVTQMNEGKVFLEKLFKGDEALRRQVYWALGKSKDPRVLPWLKKALSESNSELRKTGLSQLELLDCQKSVELLIRYLEKYSKDKKSVKERSDEICLAINALGRLKAAQAIPLLEKLASRRVWFFDGNGKILRSYARFAMGKILGS
jgi:hypothetical protein